MDEVIKSINAYGNQYRRFVTKKEAMKGKVDVSMFEKAGASGFLRKGTTPEELLTAMRVVADGTPCSHPR